MFDCNDTVTIWNKWRDGKIDVFYRHVVPVKCKFKQKIQRSIVGTAAVVSSTYVVVMPLDDAYMDAKTWAESEENRLNYYTVQKGNLIALGDIDIDITNVAPSRLMDVKELLLPDAFIVSSYLPAIKSQFGKHIRIEGV